MCFFKIKIKNKKYIISNFAIKLNEIFLKETILRNFNDSFILFAIDFYMELSLGINIT